MCFVPHWVNKGYIDSWKKCLENNAHLSTKGAETRIQTYWNKRSETTQLVETSIVPGTYKIEMPEVVREYIHKYRNFHIVPLRAETEITWKEFPMRSQYSPEQWVEEVNRKWYGYKQWTKEKWEWYLRKDEQ